jgi:hypothetical protein
MSASGGTLLVATCLCACVMAGVHGGVSGMHAAMCIHAHEVPPSSHDKKVHYAPVSGVCLAEAPKQVHMQVLEGNTVKTLTVCSNKFTYLLESTSSQQLVVTFIMGLP